MRSILSRNLIPAASSRRKGAGVRDLFFPLRFLPPLFSPRCWSRSTRECNFRARSKNPARCGIRHVRHRYNSFDETVETPLGPWLSNCGCRHRDPIPRAFRPSPRSISPVSFGNPSSNPQGTLHRDNVARKGPSFATNLKGCCDNETCRNSPVMKLIKHFGVDSSSHNFHLQYELLSIVKISHNKM